MEEKTFSAEWEQAERGRKGVLFRAEHLSLTMPAGTLFSLWKSMTLYLGRASQL